MKGRILISTEGINGTLSYGEDDLTQYRNQMENFDLFSELKPPPNNDEIPSIQKGRMFTNIDWKISTVNHNCVGEFHDPFPDLKIQVVKEIVNTGGTIDAKDIPTHTGKEISADEFHKILEQANGNSGFDEEKKEVVIIDVRNTFEHSIGHFIHPHSKSIMPSRSPNDTSSNAIKYNEKVDSLSVQRLDSQNPTPAINPNTVTFSHFDSNFCSKYSDVLKDKKVLMYCTGGIRCVKASAMLKKRGVEDVSHLSGGIHRYLEKYADKGFYKGKCMVFDQRVALDPESLKVDNDDTITSQKCKSSTVVGRCIECETPYDQLSGAHLCTVCRDLLLICPNCRENLYEYHCERHRAWKHSYFTFLDTFTIEELHKQSEKLQQLYDSYVPPKEHKNVRRTLKRQIDKVTDRINELTSSSVELETNAKRRCRTCFETSEICDGLCWGFWKHTQSTHQEQQNNKLESCRQVKIGDRVRPGPHWNEFRLGSKFMSTSTQLKTTEILKTGVVVRIKSWGSGSNENDCVAVLWNNSPSIGCGRRKRRRSQTDSNDANDISIQPAAIYRFGAVSRNGQRMYDVELTHADT